MTRATLLHVLDHTAALGPAEVRELEQLAQAFPYCQTAHLLLAKAAHDQGTMLAGQRLRRAATYAADRTLLRQLIEQVEPAAEKPTDLLAEVGPVEAEIPALAVFKAGVASETFASDPARAEAAAGVVTPVAAVSESIAPAAVPTPGTFGEEASQDLIFASGAAPATEEEVAVEETETRATLFDQGGIETSLVEAGPETFVEVVAEEGGPAQAPAIRPPTEVGEARFEFGLVATPPPAAPGYELPGLVDEWAASAVTRGLGSSEPLPALAPTAAETALAAAAFTPAAFTGDAAVGYAVGESSRLGFSMQLLDSLAVSAEAAEPAALTAMAQPPAAPLPPPGAFFEPDPLLLEHWATHCPQTPPLPSSLELINSFLRRQPRLTRPAMLPPAASTQADLSVHSTRAEPELASESLARILVRQGKTARAIEIYERLMVKQPEKMAYFAAQIQQLQPPA